MGLKGVTDFGGCYETIVDLTEFNPDRNTLGGARGIAVDPKGRVVVAGKTHSSIEGQKFSGGKDIHRMENDMFVSWLNREGERLKTRLYGVPWQGGERLGEDGARGLTLDKQGVFIFMGPPGGISGGLKSGAAPVITW